MRFIFFISELTCFGFSIMNVNGAVKKNSKMTFKIKIELVAYNLDKVVDEHGGHETANIWDQLSHLEKQREYGPLFGFF